MWLMILLSYSTWALPGRERYSKPVTYAKIRKESYPSKYMSSKELRQSLNWLNNPGLVQS